VVTSVIATEGDGRWIEYAGGYSDMLAQRGAAKPPEAVAPRARGTRDIDPAARVPSRKLSFKDKHALETLPARITDLEQEIGRLNRVLSDGDLYTRQPAKFAEASKALEAAQAELAKAEEQWLALEMMREALEAG
jgi:ATP-binding cassette subfamily F protein uup